MKTIGDPIFARDAEGKLLSRIGTMFFRTPGLVTTKGIHAMQRLRWLEAIGPLTPAEEEAELAESVDLVFTEDCVLIRPDPERMDLALRADEELQKLVSKRRIRYLNTSSVKVRTALCERGENWRMARQPISQEDMSELVENSRVPICEQPIYYYNKATGTRFLTCSSYATVSQLPDDEYRRQVLEIVGGLNHRNRLGQPEVDLFPPTTPIEIKKALRQVACDTLSDAELRRCIGKIETDWRMALPSELREESVANYEWRNEMCHAITRQPNETNAEEQELVSGISAEFYRQIEWLPGARIVDGEVVFDPLYDEAAKGDDPELAHLCDNRVKSLVFNLTRLFGAVDFINVGRIARSLARRPVAGNRRGSVYIVQYREAGCGGVRMLMMRLQKWGVAERLDEGKDLLQAINETDEYSDYILDRRLMCRQLGMRLPKRIGYGHFTETYRGASERYSGMPVRTAYFVRPYVRGIASDKVPPPRFRNPAFAQAFARLMGEAAALDMVVGRASSVTGEILFDKNYEVLQLGADSLPASLTVTDHAGSFTNYEHDFEGYVAVYADAVRRRRRFVADYASFVDVYVGAFVARLREAQEAYRTRRHAFDGLFKDRPYDANGSGSYRWSCVLRRLDRADPERLGALLREAAEC